MLRDPLSSSPTDARRMSEMDSAILRSLDRLVGQLIQSTWQELVDSLQSDADPVDFSGVHALGGAGLVPYLDRPGVFLIFGPLPEVRILHLGCSRTAMHSLMNLALISAPDRHRSWDREVATSVVPTYAACVCMEGNWSLIPTLSSRLAHYLAPLQSVQKGSGGVAQFD